MKTDENLMLILITCPTASGASALAPAWRGANANDHADSMQVGDIAALTARAIREEMAGATSRYRPRAGTTIER